jgi:hypothetical protein
MIRVRRKIRRLPVQQLNVTMERTVSASTEAGPVRVTEE